MTQDQTRRTIEALAETHRLIDKEEKYLPQLQKADYLAGLYAHVAKLNGMLAAPVPPTA